MIPAERVQEIFFDVRDALPVDWFGTALTVGLTLLCFVELVRRRQHFRAIRADQRTFALAILVSVTIALCVTSTVMLRSGVDAKRTLVAALDEGRAWMVEGAVSGFTSLEPGKKTPERFRVDTVSFTISTVGYGGAYRGIGLFGQPLRNGQRVRVWEYRGMCCASRYSAPTPCLLRGRRLRASPSRRMTTERLFARAQAMPAQLQSSIGRASMRPRDRSSTRLDGTSAAGRADPESSHPLVDGLPRDS